MSTLEQIRQRPILIISILGLALLLFIITAADDPLAAFKERNTLAKVDGEKIEYMDFQRRVEQQQEQLRSQGYNNPDVAQVQQYVLQQMLNEALMKKEQQRLGMVVTDKELSEAMLGKTPHPYVQQMVRQMGIPSVQLFYEAAFNPTKNGIDPQQAQQLQQAWTALEKDTEQMLLAAKFNNLFFGAVTANKLDAKTFYEDNNSASTITYARKDLAGLADKDFPVSDDEVMALYNKEKNRFRIDQPQYSVSYVTVDITPSQADLAKAQSDVENAIVGLRTTPGTEAVEGNNNFYVNRVNQPASRMAPNLKGALEQLAKDSVTMVGFVDDQYTVAKLFGTTSQVDSVLLDLAILSPDVSNDSIVGLLNSGKKPAELGTVVAQQQDSMWISLLDPSLGLLKDEIANAETGRYFQPRNNNGQEGMTLRVRKRQNPVTVYDLAEITYDVLPSSATIKALGDSLRSFVASNATYDAFTKNATAKGYNALPAIVTPSSLSVNGLPESRNAAKWTLDAKRGQVSPVFNDDRNDRLMAVAVYDVYDGNFLPASYPEVRDYLTARVRNQKKADKLVADYKGKGKTVADYAGAMGVNADTTAVTFGRNNVAGFGRNESALNANVALAKAGQTVGPLALDDAVVVFEVTATEAPTRPFDYANDAMVFNQREGAFAFQNSMFQVLLGNKKIDNRIQQFYSADQQ